MVLPTPPPLPRNHPLPPLPSNHHIGNTTSTPSQKTPITSNLAAASSTPNPNQNPNSTSASGQNKSLKEIIAHSQAIYRRDLRALFGHAKDRFGDVKWTGGSSGSLAAGLVNGARAGAGNAAGDGVDEGDAEGMGFEVVDFAFRADTAKHGRESGQDARDEKEEEAVWAHKAIIYARASKSFKSRFFPSHASASGSQSQTGGSTSRAPSTTPSTHAHNQHLHPNSHSGTSTGQPRPPRYTRSSSVLSNRPRDAHGVTVLDDLGMKELLSLGLEGMYDPDVSPRAGMGIGMGIEGMGGEGVGGLGAGGDEEEGGMEWLLMQGNEAGREGDMSFGLGLGVGLGMGIEMGARLDKGKGREVDGARMEEIRSLMREKQSQDLTYMWRSKLYADVLIQIPNPTSSSSSSTTARKGAKPPPSSFRQTPVIRRATSFSSVKQPTEGGARPGSSLSFNLDLDKDLGFEVDEDTGGMTFSAHRFMLCSRSPYFAQVLLNAGEFQPHLASAAFHSKGGSMGQARQAGMPVIALSSPPFTPQTMHFVLGYIYSGSLGRFSNKQLDMTTALLVRKGAAYLEMEALEKEVEGRLIWEFAHGVAWDDRIDESIVGGRGAKVRSCRCRKCVKRVPRLLRFATSPDVASKQLESLTKEYVVRGWSECLGKDVAMLDERIRDEVVDAIIDRITFQSVVTSVRGLLVARRRLEQDGKPGDEWFDDIEDVLDIIAERIVEVMTSDFDKVLLAKEMVDLVEKPLVDFEVLEALLNLLVQGVGRVEYCRHAPSVYEALICNLLDKRDDRSEQLVLSEGSRVREVADVARTGILSVLRKRWMQIRQESGFVGLESSTLERLAKSMGVSPDDLVQQVPKRKPAVSLNSSTASRTSADDKRDQPKPRSRMPSLDSRTSVRAPPTLGPPVAVSTSTSSVPLPRSASRHVSRADTTTPAIVAPGRPTATSSRQTVASSSMSHTTAGGRVAATATRRIESTSSKSPPSRLARVAGGTNAQAGPSVPKTPPGESTISPPRPRALSTPGSHRRKTSGIELAPPVPSVQSVRSNVDRVVPSGSSDRVNTNTPEPKAVSTGPRAGEHKHATSRQSSIASLSDFRDRTMSTQSLQAAGSKTPSATPGNSPGRRTPTSTRPQKTSTSPSVTTRSPLTPRDKVPPMPSAKPTASTLAKKVSTPALHAKRAEELKKVPTKSPSSSSIRNLRMSPAPSKTSTSTLAAPTKSTLANARSRVTSTSTIRSRVDSNLSLAEKTTASGSRSIFGPTISKLKAADRSEGTTATKQKELSETTDDAPTEIITPTVEKGDALNVPTIVGPEVEQADASDEHDGLPKSIEPASTSLSTPPTALLTVETEPDLNSTLPRSFGSQLDTQKKIVLGLPVPSETRRPSMQMLRTASASASLAYGEPSGRYHPAAAFDPPPRAPATSTPVNLVAPIDDGIPLVESNYGSSLSVGIPCIVALSQARVHKFKAMARYIGRLDTAKMTGEWVGVEVEERFLGKTGLQETEDRFICDGTFEGRRYFRLEQHGSSLRRASHANFGQTASIRGRLRGGSTAPHDIYGRRGMRSASASPVPWQRVDDENSSPGKTVALFVRPNEIVFVLEATE